MQDRRNGDPSDVVGGADPRTTEREAEGKYRAIFEQAAVGIARMRWPGVFLEVNHRLCQILGYTREELLATGFADVLHPDDLKASVSFGRQHKEEGAPTPSMEARFLRKDGSEIWCRGTVSLIPSDESEATDAIVVLEDVTVERRALEELAEARVEWEQIFEAIGHPTVILDTEHRVIAANRAVLEKVGGNPEGLVGLNCWEIFHGPDCRKSPPNCPLEAMKAGGHLETTAMEMRVFGGSFLLSCTPVLDRQGQLDKVIHIATDITERKRAEQREKEHLGELAFLAQSAMAFVRFPADGDIYRYVAERLIELVPGAVIGVAHIDKRSGDIRPEVLLGLGSVATQTTEMLGKRLDSISVKASDELLSFMLQGRLVEFPSGIHGITGGSVPKTVAAALEKMLGIRKIMLMGFERGGELLGGVMIILRRGGAIANRTLVEAFVGQAAVAIEHYIAAQALKRSEEQLAQSQKMEAIGTLAGGVAHDFNNLLTGILFFSSELKGLSQPGEKIYEDAALIEGSAEHAAELTGQLLGFARKGKMEETSVDTADLFHDVVAVLRRTTDKRITISETISTGHETVLGDVSQLQQVVLNLGVNACDAMPDGGQLRFDAHVVNLDDVASKEVNGLTPGEYIEIQVSDTGTGMSSEVRERLFEPFFTTKENGTGMGLATAYGIVRNHGGSISVEPNVGMGTTFRVFLPVHGRVADPAAPEIQAPVEGEGRILVADDEPLIRELATRLFTRLGYEVTTVEDGQAALEHFQQHHSEIDLVVLDLVMPRMNGRDCLERLRAINPEVRVLLSSGYAPDETFGDLFRHGRVGFIQKPFQAAQLSRAVSEALQHARQDNGPPLLE